MKMYEITGEVTNCAGVQIFACYAENTAEAGLKFARGECNIIDYELEVTSLNRVPLEIIESDDISSRLSSDIAAKLAEENRELREVLAKLIHATYNDYDADIDTIIVEAQVLL